MGTSEVVSGLWFFKVKLSFPTDQRRFLASSRNRSPSVCPRTVVDVKPHNLGWTRTGSDVLASRLICDYNSVQTKRYSAVRGVLRQPKPGENVGLCRLR